MLLSRAYCKALLSDSYCVLPNAETNFGHDSTHLSHSSNPRTRATAKLWTKQRDVRLHKRSTTAGRKARIITGSQEQKHRNLQDNQSFAPSIPTSTHQAHVYSHRCQRHLPFNHVHQQPRPLSIYTRQTRSSIRMALSLPHHPQHSSMYISLCNNS